MSRPVSPGSCVHHSQGGFPQWICHFFTPKCRGFPAIFHQFWQMRISWNFICSYLLVESWIIHKRTPVPNWITKRLVSNLKRTISNNIQQIGQLPLSQKIGYLQTHVSIVSSFPIKLTSLEYPQNWTPWSHHQLGPFVQRPQRIERRCSWQFHCEGPCSSGAARGPPVYWRNLNRFWECSECEQIWYMMVCAVCIMRRLYVCDI